MNRLAQFTNRLKTVATTIWDGANAGANNQRQRSTVLKDTKRELTQTDWKRLVVYSRNLFANYGALRGPILDMATWATVDGWFPQYVGKDKDWGKQAEQALWDWFEVCDVRGRPYSFHVNLFLDSVALDRDGDTPTALVKSGDGWPMIQKLPNHRIGSLNNEQMVESGQFKGREIYNGVIVNEVGRAIGYRILDPMTTSGTVPGYRDITAFDAWLNFVPELHDQCRGLPVLSHAITDAQDLQDIQHYLKLGVKSDASIGLIEHNETGASQGGASWVSSGTVNAAGTGVTVEELDGASIRYFKANSGGDLKPFVSDRPSGNVPVFIEHVLRGIYQGMGLPYELRDASKIGGANVRFVLERAEKAVRRRQEVLRLDADRQIKWALANFIQLGVLPVTDDWWLWEWQMPKRMSVDRGRDGKQAIEEMKIGGKTLADYCAESGRFWEDVRRQQAVENKNLIDAAKELVTYSGGELSFDEAMQLIRQNNPNPPLDTRAEGRNEPTPEPEP